jgi:hypothetical protein
MKVELSPMELVVISNGLAQALKSVESAPSFTRDVGLINFHSQMEQVRNMINQVAMTGKRKDEVEA